MADVERIQEHMEVVGSDGKHVGTVDKVEGDRIKLTRTDRAADGVHRYIAADLVRAVERRVELARPADEVRRTWETDESEGEGGTDRGPSATR